MKELMRTDPSRPTNRRVANVTGLVAFTATLAVLGLTGAAVALLDPGPTSEGPGPALAILVLLGVSDLVGVAARALALFVLRRTRPGGV